MLAILALGPLLSSCVFLQRPVEEPPLFLQKTSFAALPGWAEDDPVLALTALQKSCAVIVKKEATAEMTGGFAGTVADWQDVCQKLSIYLLATPAEAHRFFEENFTPYAMYAGSEREGLFTGYYEPLLQGSLEKKPPYLYPLYGRPADLITVNLGDFRPELKGETIVGRVAGENFVPYFTRKEINAGALDAQKKEIVYVDDAVDVFFLHIQGSGQVVMEDGAVLRVGYAAQNGHVYEAIGRELIRRGALAKEDVSMQSIRAWLEAHPDEAEGLMDINASYIFFRALEGEGPLGAQGVALTPGRSLAVDRKKIPYGAPVYLDAEGPSGIGRLQRLMIAQDTGGAIRGAVRGDFFWGAGADAENFAGVMKSKGMSYILLPNTVEVPEDRMYKGFLDFLK